MVPVALVAFIVDDSGSMRGRSEATRAAFNAYVGVLKKTKGAEIKFSVYTFRADIQVNAPIQDAVTLTEENYRATYSNTPLWREIGRAISALDAELKKSGPRKVVLCVQTDGGDPTDYLDCRRLVEARMRDGWEFIWMGTGTDKGSSGDFLCIEGARKLGIPKANIMQYGNSASKTMEAFTAAAWNIGAMASMRATTVAFTEEQQKAAK